jgi:import inner membrane translocase subunit TIM50
MYLEEMAFIEKNKDEFERLIELDKQAMAKQMPDNLFGMLNALTFGPQPPEPPKEGLASGASAGGAEAKET